MIIFTQFKVSNDCKSYKRLLHYTDFDTLKIILSDKTLKCNSLKHVNDRFEQNRKGIEDKTDSFYVSCFCHNQYEIVPFWFMYGGRALDCKILLKFKNFASSFEKVIESDWAFTSEKKTIYFNHKKLFGLDKGNLVYCPIDNPLVESRQIISAVRLFDIKYLPPYDENFSKDYKTQVNTSVVSYDLRSAGKQKKINWKYEDETRIQCIMNSIEKHFLDYILLRLKDEIFQDLVIVANPWASDKFIEDIYKILDESTLPNEIKRTITIQRSELHGEIDRKIIKES